MGRASAARLQAAAAAAAEAAEAAEAAAAEAEAEAARQEAEAAAAAEAAAETLDESDSDGDLWADAVSSRPVVATPQAVRRSSEEWAEAAPSEPGPCSAGGAYQAAPPAAPPPRGEWARFLSEGGDPEAARRGWLTYHIGRRNYRAAMDLVVSTDEEARVREAFAAADTASRSELEAREKARQIASSPAPSACSLSSLDSDASVSLSSVLASASDALWESGATPGAAADAKGGASQRVEDAPPDGKAPEPVWLRLAGDTLQSTPPPSPLPTPRHVRAQDWSLSA